MKVLMKIQSPAGSSDCVKRMDKFERLSPFRTSLKKMETGAFSPDKLKQWGQNISPFSKKRLEETGLFEREVKIRIQDHEDSQQPIDVSSVSSLTSSLRAKYKKRKLNLLYEDREFDPVDLSIDLCADFSWRKIRKVAADPELQLSRDLGDRVDRTHLMDDRQEDSDLPDYCGHDDEKGVQVNSNLAQGTKDVDPGSSNLQEAKNDPQSSASISIKHAGNAAIETYSKSNSSGFDSNRYASDDVRGANHLRRQEAHFSSTSSLVVEEGFEEVVL